MESKAKSIRPFVGAQDYITSRVFYSDLGFNEIIIDANLSLFQWGEMGFYLQNAYVKDWIENTMVFMEVEDVNCFWKELVALDLTSKYKNVKLVAVKERDWGKECFVHDPAGVLWHFGEFY